MPYTYFPSFQLYFQTEKTLDTVVVGTHGSTLAKKIQEYVAPGSKLLPLAGWPGTGPSLLAGLQRR
jgi:hypothetical protein